MYTVESILSRFTNSHEVFLQIKDTLQTIDPNFEDEYCRYVRAVEDLENALCEDCAPCVSDYIAAKEKAFSSEMLYVAWLGFQQNLECFRNPINSMFLELDFETIHREHSFCSLPDVARALSVINSFDNTLRKFPDNIQSLTMGITEFFSYLETVGFKLAHYFGFVFADGFLEHVIPGYCPDLVTTGQYAIILEDYLDLDLRLLE